MVLLTVLVLNFLVVFVLELELEPSFALSPLSPPAAAVSPLAAAVYDPPLAAAASPVDSEELELVSVDELELLAAYLLSLLSYSGPLAWSEVALLMLRPVLAESSEASTFFSYLVAVLVVSVASLASAVSLSPLDEDSSFRVFTSLFYVLEVVFVSSSYLSSSSFEATSFVFVSLSESSSSSSYAVLTPLSRLEPHE